MALTISDSLSVIGCCSSALPGWRIIPHFRVSGFRVERLTSEVFLFIPQSCAFFHGPHYSGEHGLREGYTKPLRSLLHGHSLKPISLASDCIKEGCAKPFGLS